ncbi:cytochrome c-type biogenesis protein [Cobetia sp. MB87]|uniref:cytochrome c-type biogenesis protein n=1 Tax=Cobetia sp. MB87 TaxID=2588451 RepID=UPI0014080E53|nr:cytochrome c-type biogenesis protein [Cobetia sp. MB87]NHH86929.1 Cytochrome c-type biogenesis protein CcmH [Cobetia sp. MB87]
MKPVLKSFAIPLVQALVVLLFLSWLAAGKAQAAIEVHQFDNPVLQKRYDSLTAALRCPKCQNQAIGDSDSPIAGDMRQNVADLLKDGRSDSEIQNFMVARFGEYVLYNPRLDGRTWLLWGGPAALILLGLIIVALIVRARRRARVRALDPEEQARLSALLNTHRQSSDELEAASDEQVSGTQDRSPNAKERS